MPFPGFSSGRGHSSRGQPGSCHRPRSLHPSACDRTTCTLPAEPSCPPRTRASAPSQAAPAGMAAQSAARSKTAATGSWHGRSRGMTCGAPWPCQQRQRNGQCGKESPRPWTAQWCRGCSRQSWSGGETRKRGREEGVEERERAKTGSEIVCSGIGSTIQSSDAVGQCSLQQQTAVQCFNVVLHGHICRIYILA